MSTLVIRYSSMGDVVLAGAVTQALAPVTFLTHPAWVELAAALPGVERVLASDRVTAAELAGPWSAVVDLQASPRSRRDAARAGGPLRRVERHDLRRRLRVWLKVGAPPPRVTDRYAQAAGTTAAPRPWLAGWTDPGSGGPLVLCPGAAHATKRWSAERFAEVGRGWEGPVVVLGGPGDEALVQEVAEAIGPEVPAVAERGFARTLQILREAAAVVAGDTGLMHLAGALGVPVVAVFGPTTSADGFWDPAVGRVVEVDLPCRPCSRHGGPRCPFGDHRCMEALGADAVLAALREATACAC